MHYLAFLFAVVLLAANTPLPAGQTKSQTGSQTQAKSAEQQMGPVDSVAQYLLTAAATDFHAHGPSGPLRFREVRMGHALSPDGANQYRLCGEFIRTRPGVKSQWTPFVTIKTRGFEQSIGAQAAAFCQDSSVIWDNTADLTSSLQDRFDSLR